MSFLRWSEAAPATLPPPFDYSMRFNSAPGCGSSATGPPSGVGKCMTMHACWQRGPAQLDHAVVASGRQEWMLRARRGHRRLPRCEPYGELDSTGSAS